MTLLLEKRGKSLTLKTMLPPAVGKIIFILLPSSCLKLGVVSPDLKLGLYPGKYALRSMECRVEQPTCCDQTSRTCFPSTMVNMFANQESVVLNATLYNRKFKIGFSTGE